MEDDFRAEVRGRLAALETIVGVLITHTAELAPQPHAYLADVMDNVAAILLAARDQALPEDHRDAAHALASFERLSQFMLAHVAERMAPQGRV